MEEKKINIVRKGITKTVEKVIPEQTITEEVEVDTLKEFLAEVGLNESQLRIAAKAYNDEKISQPSYNMDDILQKVKEGKAKAEKYSTSTDKKIEVTDGFIADALVASKNWKCTGKSLNPKKYILERI